MFPLNTAVKTVYILEHSFYCSRSTVFLWEHISKILSIGKKVSIYRSLIYKQLLNSCSALVVLLDVPWWPSKANASFIR